MLRLPNAGPVLVARVHGGPASVNSTPARLGAPERSSASHLRAAVAGLQFRATLMNARLASCADAWGSCAILVSRRSRKSEGTHIHQLCSTAVSALGAGTGVAGLGDGPHTRARPSMFSWICFAVPSVRRSPWKRARPGRPRGTAQRSRQVCLHPLPRAGTPARANARLVLFGLGLLIDFLNRMLRPAPCVALPRTTRPLPPPQRSPPTPGPWPCRTPVRRFF